MQDKIEKGSSFKEFGSTHPYYITASELRVNLTLTNKNRMKWKGKEEKE